MDVKSSIGIDARLIGLESFFLLYVLISHCVH
jgi:hypothetical protein